MADAKMVGLEKVLARLSAIPAAVQKAAADQLKVETDGMVDAIKRAAPVDTKGAKPGELRDSVHAYANPDRPLSYRILADAKDAKGDFIGSHVEAGHRTAEGEHVAAQPFFFPTYRARKKGAKRRMNAAAKKAVKAAFPEAT